MGSFKLSKTFSRSSKELYNAWLDTELHSVMTGGEAACSNKEGEGFSAWDGYITGTNKKLIEGKEIIQSWRTADFEDADTDSLLTLQFKDIDDGCELTLIHTNIPDGQPNYEQGWIEHYFEPMKKYFG